MIKLKLSSQLIGQFGHVIASASCKQPEKHGKLVSKILDNCCPYKSTSLANISLFSSDDCTNQVKLEASQYNININFYKLQL